MDKKIKVAVINPSFNYEAGIDQVIYNLCEKLKEQCDITVFCTDSNINANGYTVVKIPAQKIMGDSSVHLAWKLRKTVKDYDIIHTHNLPLDWVLYLRYGNKMIYTYHGFGPDPPRTKKSIFHRKFLKYVILRTGSILDRQIVSISNYGANEIKRYGAKKVKVIPNGVNTDFFIPAYEEKNYIICVGRIVPYKGIDGLIRIMHLLKKEGYAITLKIVGTGWYRQELEDLVKKLRLEDIVEFLGFVDEENIVRLYQESMFFVTNSSWEHFGLPVLEANACGKPVIARAVGGVPEIVKDGVTGFIFNNLDELLEYVKTLLDNKKLRLEMGREARKHAEMFDWTNGGKRYLELYKKIMKPS